MAEDNTSGSWVRYIDIRTRSPSYVHVVKQIGATGHESADDLKPKKPNALPVGKKSAAP